MATTLHETPSRRHSCWTKEYGLLHCEGYRVAGPRGPLGYVEEVRVDELGEVCAIVVAGARRLLVSAREIGSVDVDSELIRLTSQAEQCSTSSWTS
jgi:hypothetical protein